MPLTIPTPAELAAMPWHSRDRVIRFLRAYERELGLHVEPVTRTRLTPQQRAQRADERRRQAEAWGEAVREEARRLEREGWGA